jgi:hypothetical protein
MKKILVALLLLIASPAYALTDAQQTRLTFLELKLTALKQEKVKAVHAHDMWLNRLQVEKLYPGLPHNATEVFKGRENWSEALRKIWRISDQVYPDEAGPALMTSPEAGLSEPERRAHREAAIPEIEALERRIENEIEGLKKE